MVTSLPRWLVFLALAVVYFNYADCRTSDTLKVKLNHGGKVVGRYLTTVKGRGMRAFMGIPYAKPPVGELRFMPPVPFPKWKGEKLTVKDSEICIQRDPFRRDQVMEGSEDCLYLNVYTPPVEEVKSKKLPVMVWFHGGGWECGSGISEYYGPDHLLEKDIVYVAGNFRLGPLGFLSTETLDCPGNNGMKDQVEILKWVKENIARFGGDPDNVTIFGESAGGASVTYHMMSKMSKGLFHKGIAQSGTYHNPWAQPAHKGVAAHRAFKLAKLLHCENSEKNWKLMLDCMRKLPADLVTAKLYDFYDWDYEPMIPFPLAVEPEHPGAFITQYPRDIDHSKLHSLSIPLMIGATSGEGALRSAAYLNNMELLQAMKEKYKFIWPIMLNYDHHDIEKQKQITKALDEFYFKDGHNYKLGDGESLTDLISDGWFIAGMDEYLRQRMSGKSQKIAGPTYAYLFDQKPSASFTEIFHGGRENFVAVSHAEELQYLFPIGKHLFISSIPTKDELKVRDGLVEMWVNFATLGNPTPQTSKITKWKPTSSYPLDYVRIGTQNPENWVLLQNEKNYLQDRCDLWNRLNAHYPRKSLKTEL